MVGKLIIPKPKLILPHASAGDWDFSDPNWKITTLQYVSPPSALQLGTTATLTTFYVLCKNAAVLKLSQGRIITWVRLGLAGRNIYFSFRNTAAPGTSNINNCYRVHFTLSGTTWELREYLNKANTRNWTQAKTACVANTWYRFRLSWWLSWEVMVVSLDREIDGAWVQQGDVISVPNPLFGDAQYQRPGIGGQGNGSGDQAHIDDTEIWEYIP